MALSSGNLVAWSDINTLFTNLNTQRTKFKFSTISTPSGGQGKITYPNVVSSLKSGLSDMTSNQYVGNKISPSSITVPAAGSLLKPGPLTTIQSQITTLQGLNFAFNSPVFTSNFSGFFSSNFSGFNSSFCSFSFGESTDFSVGFGFTFSSWCGSCNGFSCSFS